MKEWFTIAELAAAGLPGLPTTEKGLDKIARSKWRGCANLSRQVVGRTKPVWEYHISLLPSLARSRLVVVCGAAAISASELERRRATAAWSRFESLSIEHQKICEERLRVLLFAKDLQAGGLGVREAVAGAAVKFGCSQASIFNWQRLVEGFDRCDWLAALAPSFATGGHNRAECHEAAWEVLCADYLRASGPAFSSCYRRMKQAAKEHGWAPIPSERALRRRLDGEVPKAVQVLTRKGEGAAKVLYPAQMRDRSGLHAMEAVNMDGHKLDVFVRVPWKDKAVRLYLIGIQDLYSNKVLAWRLSDAETWEIVRLVIGDMVEEYGIPEAMVLDNGRAFTSKWISGGVKNRFRFKVRDDDPRGLLTTLGINMHWSKPGSGQSKPIERAWRDLAESIAKHPFCAGAYTGNKPDAKPEDYGRRAVEYEAFKRHVAARVEEHNAQEGRKTANATRGGECVSTNREGKKGRSFDAVFAESLASEGTIVRRATAAQKALWLLASEAVQVRKGSDSGQIHFAKNRYWDKALLEHMGEKVIIRFDPDNLHKALRVYDLENRLICEAECIEDTGFLDQAAARLHERARGDFDKANKARAKAIVRLRPEELADIYGRADRAADKRPKQPIPRPKVTRLVHGNLALKPRVEEDLVSDEEFEAGFSKAMRLVANGEVVTLPVRK